MLRSLSSKLALVLMLVFGLIATLVVVASHEMLEASRVPRLAAELVVGAIAFSLLAAITVFGFLTRRLGALAAAIDQFRESGFAHPVRFAGADPRGDEIERLGAAFQEMSQRIACQLRALEKVDQGRRELLANVSHDLRTPLASMQGYLETLLLRGDSLSAAESRNYLEVATRHCERLGRLVRDLFELTKLEAHEIRPNLEVFPVSELAQDVAQKFQLGAEKRGLRVEAWVPPDVPAVRADIGMIERVLENLVENAMRHTPAGGVVRIAVEAAGECVAVSVNDTGRGIPSEDLPHVFDRFFRVDRGESGDGGHAGLGLAITRLYVELHGGTVKVDSRLGLGTTFRFDLPCAPMVSQTLRAPVAA
jgi:hypothetical protein